jgi:hypothetical protein
MPRPTLAGVGLYLNTHGYLKYIAGQRGGYRITRPNSHTRIITHVTTLDAIQWGTNPARQQAVEELRRKETPEKLRDMQQVLEQAYAVALVNDPGKGLCLRVRSKPGMGRPAPHQKGRQEGPGSDLTPPQRRALRLIREGGVEYRYEGGVPRFGARLPSQSVLALERRGLVRLEPVTPEYGRVVAVPQEDTDG